MITREQRDEAVKIFAQYYLQNITYPDCTYTEVVEKHTENTEVMEAVVDVIAKYNLTAKTRKQKISHKRMALMWWMCKNMKITLDDIAKMFKYSENEKRTHTAPIYAKRAIDVAIEMNQLTDNMTLILDEMKPFEKLTTHLQNTTAQHNAEREEQGNS